MDYLRAFTQKSLNLIVKNLIPSYPKAQMIYAKQQS